MFTLSEGGQCVEQGSAADDTEEMMRSGGAHAEPTAEC